MESTGLQKPELEVRKQKLEIRKSKLAKAKHGGTASPGSRRRERF